MAIVAASPRPFARNKSIATGLLLGATALFGATLVPQDPSLWVLLLRGVAEAGMIGGLADWFAVEALFRHPLGLKIPHTALLPSSKDRVAKQIGRFVTEQFLSPVLIREKLADVPVAAVISNWLERPGNASLVAQRLGGFASGGLAGFSIDSPPPVLKDKLRDLFLHPDFDEFMRRQIASLLASNFRVALTDHALRGLADLIDNNRPAIEQLIHSRSRWWIAASADRTLSRLMVDQVLELMTDLQEHSFPLRRDFDALLEGFVTDPAQSKPLTRTLRNMALRIVDSRDFDAAMGLFMNALIQDLAQDMDRPESAPVQMLEQALIKSARQLNADDTQSAQVSRELIEAVATVLEGNTELIVNFIADTVQAWDAQELVTLFEDQVGNDLQFIRINGTVLGGLIGGVLFLIADLLPALL